MKKNFIHGVSLLVIILAFSACKKENVGNGTKAVFSYVADGFNVNFTNFSTNATEFHWEFGDGSGVTSDLRSPQHVFTRKGDFLVSLTAKNGADSSRFVDTVSILGPNIKIDGDFSDWQYVTFTHQNNAASGGTLLGVKAFASSDMINFYIEGTAGMNLELMDMYIDADNNPATGFSTWLYPAGSGAEFLLEGPPVNASWGGVFLHSGAPTAFSFSQVGAFADLMNFSPINTVNGKKIIEFSLKKSALGTPKNFINFALIELTGGWADIGKLPEAATPTSKFIAVPL